MIIVNRVQGVSDVATVQVASWNVEASLRIKAVGFAPICGVHHALLSTSVGLADAALKYEKRGETHGTKLITALQSHAHAWRILDETREEVVAHGQAMNAAVVVSGHRFACRCIILTNRLCRDER